ncbi:MAG: glycosyltransferase family 39 protein [Nitrospinota bacterium]
MISGILQGSRIVHLGSRLLSAFFWLSARVDEAICASWTARLLGLGGALQRWMREKEQPPPGSGRRPAPIGWAGGSLILVTARRVGAAFAAGGTRLAREGVFGRWWAAVAQSRKAAPQRTLAAIVLSALSADSALLLVSGVSLNAEGLVVRGFVLAGALTAVCLEEGRFVILWRSWWVGRLIKVATRGTGAPPGVAASPGRSPKLGPSVGAGALLGVLWWLSPGIVFLALVGAGLAACLKHAAPSDENRFLVGLFSASAALRAVIVAVVYVWAVAQGRFYPQPGVLEFQLSVPMVFGDGGYFTSRAWALSQIWRGAEVWPHALFEIRQEYGATAFLYVPAVFFYLFGPDGLIAVRFINVLIGACIPLVVYGLARDLFGPSAARISSVTAALFPSLILWNLDLLKDSLFIVLALWALWMSVRFQQRRRVGYLVTAAVAAGISLTVRYNLGLLVFGVVGLGLVPFFWRWWVGRSPSRGLLALLLLAGILLSPPVWNAMRNRLFWLFTVQRGVAETVGRSTYTLWDRRLFRHRTPENFLSDVKSSEVVRAFALGQYHFWLEPTPWGERSRVERLVIPQILLWYAILLAGLAGFWRLRRKPPELFVLLVFLTLLSATIGMTGGNVGTVFRHRDVLTPVLIVLFGGGLAGGFGREARSAVSSFSGRNDGETALRL